jgi:flagellar basal body rod protein FlgG
MNVSLYQAAAAMEGNLRRQQMIAENLAAGSIPGFKKMDMSFSAMEPGLFEKGLNAASARQVRYLFPAFSAQTNFLQGAMRPTNVPTDLAIDGPAFFSAQGPNGTLYTRDGEFHVGATGELQTKEGYPVLGMGGPIRVDPQNTAAISISATGEVSQGGIARGRVQLVEFASLDQLRRVNNGYYTDPSQQARSADATGSSLRQGHLEFANTTPSREMSELMMTLRHFEANQRVIQMQDERMNRLIQELSNVN